MAKKQNRKTPTTTEIKAKVKSGKSGSNSGISQKPPEKAKKSDKATVTQRVSEVVELKVKGYTRADIIKYAANWGCSDSQIDNYIKKANDYFEATAAISRNSAISKSRARYEFMLKSALKIFDIQAAIRAQREIDLLDGLKAPKQIQVAPQKVIVGIKKG